MRRKVSAVDARKRLGELLEGVYYRSDEVVIERAGKPMAVVIPAWLYQNMERSRDRIMELVRMNDEKNRELSEEEAAELADEAVRWARAKAAKEQKAAKG